MSERIHVGSLDDFEEDAPVRLEVEGREICIVNDGESVYALGNRCQHRLGPLHKGEVANEVGEDIENAPSGQRPELVYEDNKVLVCPWHGWEYDLATGKHAGDDDYGVPSYNVTVDGNDVFVTL